MKELASLGLDRLKSALVALGLKCGGCVTTSTSDTVTLPSLTFVSFSIYFLPELSMMVFLCS